MVGSVIFRWPIEFVILRWHAEFVWWRWLVELATFEWLVELATFEWLVEFVIFRWPIEFVIFWQLFGQTESFGDNLKILCHPICSRLYARSKEDETRNARRNANQNPEWWGDLSQLVKMRNSIFSVSRGTHSNWDFGWFWILMYLAVHIQIQILV